MKQKIQENAKKEETFKKFDDFDKNQTTVISKVAEMQKQKKLFEEDVNKQNKIIDNIKDKQIALDKKVEEKKDKQIALDKKEEEDKKEKENLNLNLDLNENPKGEENDSEKNINNIKASNINVYSSDSDSIDSDEENFTENIPSIPKEFHIEVCNKEWVVDVDPKK